MSESLCRGAASIRLVQGRLTDDRMPGRFIPQRSNNDLHASYTLLPDGPEATSGYVPSGIYGEGMAASNNARRAEMERSRKRAMMAEGDGLRGELSLRFLKRLPLD